VLETVLLRNKWPPSTNRAPLKSLAAAVCAVPCCSLQREEVYRSVSPTKAREVKPEWKMRCPTTTMSTKAVRWKGRLRSKSISTERSPELALFSQIHPASFPTRIQPISKHFCRATPSLDRCFRHLANVCRQRSSEDHTAQKNASRMTKQDIVVLCIHRLGRRCTTAVARVGNNVGQIFLQS
jgi:hypothetical protein